MIYPFATPPPCLQLPIYHEFPPKSLPGYTLISQTAFIGHICKTLRNTLMKTTILSVVLLLGITRSQAATGAKEHEKNAPVVRNICSTQLPARLLTSIKKNYKDYWITDLYKEVSNGKVVYHITLENADQKVRLNTTHSINWAVARVVPKDMATR
jgi:hypothetical protein